MSFFSLETTKLIVCLIFGLKPLNYDFGMSFSPIEIQIHYSVHSNSIYMIFRAVGVKVKHVC